MFLLLKLYLLLPLLMPTLLIVSIIIFVALQAIQIRLADIAFLFAVGTLTAMGVHYFLWA